MAFNMYIYAHGGNAAFEHGKTDILDLSASINPLGMPVGVAEAIARAAADCVRYPDSLSTALREKIAQFENVNPDWIFCGNGASDVIFRLPPTLQAAKVLVIAPSFSDYERSARAYGSEIIRYALSAADGFNLDDGFAETALAEKPGLTFLCNPNNPTGVLTGVNLIERLLECCNQNGAYVAVDECFLDFAENAGGLTSKNLLESHRNLIIIKAFTKTFALPGIRLGYAICADAALIDGLRSHGADWPVSALAQAAGAAALDGANEYIRRTASFVSAERTAIVKELSELGLTVFGSKANYIFIRNPYAFDLCGELDKYGIRIRSCVNFHGLDRSYYRIAVSTSENNARLLSSLTEIVSRHS